MYWKVNPEMYAQMQAGEAVKMPFGDQLVVALMGLATVFLCLVVLAGAVMLVSRLVSGASGAAAKKPAPVAAPAPAAPVVPAIDEESMAVVMTAVCEDLGLPMDQVRINSVQELK